MQWALFGLASACCVNSLTAQGEVRNERRRIVLCNSNLTLSLGKEEKGAVVSLRGRKRGRELAASPQSPTLFRLIFRRKARMSKSPLVLSSREAGTFRTTINKESIALRFSDFARANGRVSCLVRASVGDDLVRWRASVAFDDSLVLEGIDFPIVVLRSPLGEEVSDDALVIGSTKGGVLREPGKWKVWQRVSATQPGSLAAQFGCYYDGRGGFFTSSFDAKGYPKTLTATRTRSGIEVKWTHPCYASRSFALDYATTLGVVRTSDPGRATDWRDAADRYKKWALTQPWCARTYAQRDDVPPWMKAGPAMVRFTRTWLGDPNRIDRWLRLYWRKFFGHNTPLIIAYWGWEKVDTWVSPDYFPFYPSDEQFAALAQTTTPFRCHTFLWPSGYHWTLTYVKRKDGTFEWDDRERFARVGRAHAVVRSDGRIFERDCRWLRGGTNATMCPGDPWTREWFNAIAAKLADRGAEILQVDQVVGGRFPACYSTQHGHPPGPGLWQSEAFRKQLASMLATCRRIQPEMVIGFEEPNEHFIQQVGIQDYRDFQVVTRPSKPNRAPASVFNYLYHEFLPTFQSNPRPNSPFMQAYCLVNGQIPHLVPCPEVGPGPLLVNGGFEQWAGGSPIGWSKVRQYRGRAYAGKQFPDAAEKHDGRLSLRLENEGDDDIVQVSQNVRIGPSALQAGKQYRLRVWMKTGYLAKKNHVVLGTFAPGIKNTGTWRIPFPTEGQREWTRRGATFAIPEGSGFLRIMLHVRGKARVWLDGVTLEEVHPDGSANVVIRNETPPEHALMRQWVKLFAGRGRPYLLFGKMLHPPKLDTETTLAFGREFPAVLHNAYEAPDGSKAVILVNATEKARRAVLHGMGKPRAIELRPWEVRLLTGM